MLAAKTNKPYNVHLVAYFVWIICNIEKTNFYDTAYNVEHCIPQLCTDFSKLHKTCTFVHCVQNLKAVYGWISMLRYTWYAYFSFVPPHSVICDICSIIVRLVLILQRIQTHWSCRYMPEISTVLHCSLSWTTLRSYAQKG